MTLITRKLTEKHLVHHKQTESQTLTTGISKSKISDFEHDLKEVNWERITKETDLNHSANNFASALWDLISKHTQTWKNKPQKYSLPWFNSDILRITKEPDLALKRYLITKTNTNHLIFTGLRNKVVSCVTESQDKLFP